MVSKYRFEQSPSPKALETTVVWSRMCKAAERLCTSLRERGYPLYREAVWDMTELRHVYADVFPRIDAHVIYFVVPPVDGRPGTFIMQPPREQPALNGIGASDEHEQHKIATAAMLVTAKLVYGDDIKIGSDGSLLDWSRGMHEALSANPHLFQSAFNWEEEPKPEYFRIAGDVSDVKVEFVAAAVETAPKPKKRRARRAKKNLDEGAKQQGFGDKLEVAAE